MAAKCEYYNGEGGKKELVKWEVIKILQIFITNI